MKKLGQKGFTLIELLAVITIMGILLLVAIPAVSRTIENSRRDTFATTATEYLNAVRNAVLADNIECGSGDTKTVASATADGWYYFTVDTTADGTKDLMESGGKSPFGNSEMKGYVLWHKTTANVGAANQKTTTKYWMTLVDTGKHGFDSWKSDTEIKRANISTNTTKSTTDIPAPAKSISVGGTTIDTVPVACQLS